MAVATAGYDSPSDCSTTVDYILNNLDSFADEYNKSVQTKVSTPDGVITEPEFKATSCEFRTSVYVSEYGKEGIYIDFDNNNGYMIVVDKNEVIAFHTEGDLAYLRCAQRIQYSIYDGFFVDYGDGKFIPYADTIRSKIPNLYFNDTIQENYGIDLKGTTPQAGIDGGFEKPIDAVRINHGTGWSPYKVKSLAGFEYTRQYKTTVYYQIKNGDSYSEGNCALNAVYTLLSYLATNGKYSGLPKPASTKVHYAKNDPFYSKYAQKTNYDIETSKVLPTLYLTIRQYAIKHLGYEVGGVYDKDVPKIITSVGAQYLKGGLTVKRIANGKCTTVFDEIDAGYPIAIGVDGSATYGTHSMVVTGYIKYKRQRKILGIINVTDYSYVFQVSDNWAEVPRFFDVSFYTGFLNRAFSTITVR